MKGVQPCPKCGGKGFLNHDGTMNNAFMGSDSDPVISCPECNVADRDALREAAKELRWSLECVLDSLGALANPSELSGHVITGDEATRIYASLGRADAAGVEVE